MLRVALIPVRYNGEVTTRLTILAALLLAPLIWSMANENTALVKSFALGVCGAFVLLTTRVKDLWTVSRKVTPAYCLLVFALLSALRSPSPSFAWPVVLLVLSLGLLAVASSLPQPPGFWRWAIALTAVPPILVGLLQAVNLDPTPWNLILREHFHGRICSTLGNPNFYAAFLVGVLPFLVWGAADKTLEGRLRPMFLGLSAAGLVTLLLAGSKGGLLGLAAAGATLGLAMHRGGLWKSKIGKVSGRAVAGVVLLLILAGVATMAVMPGRVRDRLFLAVPEEAQITGALSIARNESVRFRALTWTQTLRMVRDAPVLGHGLGRFQVVYPRYRVPEIIRMFGQHSYMTDHPENLTLEITAELGLIGLGFWIWFILLIVRTLRDKLAAPEAHRRWLGAACASGLAGVFVTNSFGVDIHYGATAILAACLIGAALAPRPCQGSRSGSKNEAGSVGPVFGLVRWAHAVPALLLAMAWTHVYASDAALARALAHSAQGAWNSAIGFYRSAARLNPGNVMARYFGGAALLDRGREEDLPKAQRLFDSVRREVPDYVLLNYKYWLLYNRLGLTRKAQEALARQIRLDPLAAVFYLDRGRLALDEQRWEEAYQDFETATRVEPSNPSGYQYLGNLMVLRGRYQDALTVYAEGLDRNPGSEELHYNAAVAALKLGDREQALSHAKAVLRNNPGHTQAQLILSKTQP